MSDPLNRLHPPCLLFPQTALKEVISVGWPDGTLLRASNKCQRLLNLPRASRQMVLHCAHRTSTVTSCAFCEQEERSAYSLAPFRGRALREQGVPSGHPTLLFSLLPDGGLEAGGPGGGSGLDCARPTRAFRGRTLREQETTPAPWPQITPSNAASPYPRSTHRSCPPPPPPLWPSPHTSPPGGRQNGAPAQPAKSQTGAAA